MAACGTCGAGNPDGYRFCGQCGSNLDTVPCPSCNRENPAGQAFCGQCGLALDTSQATGTRVSEAATGSPDQPVGTDGPLESGGVAPVPDGPVADPVDALVPAELEERKLATVLFADVVGFTALAERTDPEVVARMVDAAFRRLSEVVTEHGGNVDKYMGDSVMAVFGVPSAHDDDAERAVAAGLAMKELGGDLAFSIGINSGEVMAATVGRAGDFTVIGDTVNVAARLEQVASAGEVLCGRLTVDLAGRGAVFRERRPVLLKGKREPVEVWEAVSLRQMDGLRGDTDARTGGPPLIGRADELAFLEAQWRRVCRDRRAQIVIICGDAGSGKTRLLGELARSAERNGTVVRTAYPAYGAMGGPRVAAEIIRQLGPLDDAEVNARLRSAAGEIDPSLQSVDPAGIRQEQLWAFRRLLHEKSTDRVSARRHRRHAQKRGSDARSFERAVWQGGRRPFDDGPGRSYRACRLALAVPDRDEGSSRTAEQSRLRCPRRCVRRRETDDDRGNRLLGRPGEREPPLLAGARRDGASKGSALRRRGRLPASLS